MTAEEFIKDYTNHCSNELADGGFHEWLTPEQALRAVEITKDAFIEKACDWLRKCLDNGLWVANDVGETEKEAIIEHFKEAMKL